jgi:hypothetical protein
MLWRGIKLYGFFVGFLMPKEGRIKYLEDRTIDLHLAGNVLEAVQRGKNNDKSVIIVSEE